MYHINEKNTGDVLWGSFLSNIALVQPITRLQKPSNTNYRTVTVCAVSYVISLRLRITDLLLGYTKVNVKNLIGHAPPPSPQTLALTSWLWLGKGFGLDSRNHLHLI